jgi:hypothetical protein
LSEAEYTKVAEQGVAEVDENGETCVKLEKDVSLYGYEMLRIIYTWQR